MKKWFNTNYHYLVPEIEDSAQIQVTGSKIFDEFEEAKAAEIGDQTGACRRLHLAQTGQIYRTQAGGAFHYRHRPSLSGCPGSARETGAPGGFNWTSRLWLPI